MIFNWFKNRNRVVQAGDLWRVPGGYLIEIVEADSLIYKYQFVDSEFSVHTEEIKTLKLFGKFIRGGS